MAGDWLTLAKDDHALNVRFKGQPSKVSYQDHFGDPLLRFTINRGENERKMAEFVTPKAVELARVMGAKEVNSFPGLKNYDANRYQFTHIQGGTIMGSSPDHSVVNPYLQHWQVPNLFVLGASTFPQNP